MTLLDAKEYDPKPARRRWQMLGAAVVILIVALILWRIYRFWPEEHAVQKFFQAVEAKNFERAYGLWNADPDWQRHPDQYKDYTYNQFVLDWGPQGEYGPITSHTVDCSLEEVSKKSGLGHGTGVIVVVIINQRRDPTSLWVEKKTKSITTSPNPAVCHGP